MSSSLVPVPATTKVVKNFLQENRDRFLKTQEYIRKKVTSNMRTVEIYKIYGRDDKQGNEPLKNPRKVRLKFNRHFKEKVTEASLFSVPDIIGFTIVVSFPSDISDVCAIIDRLVDNNELALHPEGPPPVPVKDGDKNPIKTKHGRAMTTSGYFACHYNLVEFGPGGKNKPQCEIQIKTILHDAWGAKSHDLTYKPSSKISSDLVKTFDVLGDMLARIDEQSDIVRTNIQRTAAARQRKKQEVLNCSIREAVDAIVVESELRRIKDEILLLSQPVGADLIKHISKNILENFDKDNRQSCLCYVLLSFITRDKYVFQQTLEAIEEWYENEADVLGRAYARSIAGLAVFVNNDTPGAIDEADHAANILESIDKSSLEATDRDRLLRLSHSIYSNLAYYHAESIGSHEGKLGEGTSYAKRFLERAAEVRKLLGTSISLDDADDAILECVSDLNLGWAVFSSLDTEAFVRIQTADALDDVVIIRNRLDFLHKKRPPNIPPAADALYEFHDFCARDRLAELERI